MSVTTMYRTTWGNVVPGLCVLGRGGVPWSLAERVAATDGDTYRCRVERPGAQPVTFVVGEDDEVTVLTRAHPQYVESADDVVAARVAQASQRAAAILAEPGFPERVAHVVLGATPLHEDGTPDEGAALVLHTAVMHGRSLTPEQHAAEHDGTARRSSHYVNHEH